VIVRCAGVSGAKRLEWVTRKELLNSTWTRREMHPYALEMLQQLTSCSIMRRLEDLFDLAASPRNTSVASASNDASLNSGKTPAQVAQHFEITSSSRSCLEAALPDHVQSSVPTAKKCEAALPDHVQSSVPTAKNCEAALPGHVQSRSLDSNSRPSSQDRGVGAIHKHHADS
jgi:hypothetical protein